jgi:dipeptidyl aminopeptidase/acylaminoacyl peptidase
MNKDIRDTSLYREAEALYTAVRRPGTGLISDAAEVSTDGTRVAFAGTAVDKLEGTPPTRICLTDLATGDVRVVTFGPSIDRLPKFSPDGRLIAFLSDRNRAGDFQLYLLDLASGAARATPTVPGWVEYLHWSPDGKRLLLAVAGHGADIAGGQGAVTSKQPPEALPSWMPAIETGDEHYRWRSAWIYELATDQVRQASRGDINIWEAAWCGNDAIAAVTSLGPGEGLWYSAQLSLIEIQSGQMRQLYEPKDQLGWPAASPSGRHLAVVEAICSDRWIVAGDLQLIEIASGKAQRVDTAGVDITYTEWRSDRHLLIAGHRGFATVVGAYDLATKTFTESWSSYELSTGGFYVTVAGLGEPGDCILVGEGFLRAPEIAVIRRGHYRPVRSFDTGYADQVRVLEAPERVTWKAPDGLDIQGWLMRPNAKAPYPLVLNIHGGPVWQSHPMWLGRRVIATLMLLKRGCAVFLTNPRGSTGHGQEFVGRVVGDLGGAETYDHLSGIDYLVQKGIADPKRLGVTGGSHGGFMTSWLISQDSRFAAAVSVSPVINQVSEHLIGNIPHFVSLFLKDQYNKSAGKYFERSPIMHAHKVRTPTLNICGALDRCTPPEEAMQFHRALLENRVRSVLVTYPEEGHGVRKWPAATDQSARVVSWFEEHLKT